MLTNVNHSNLLSGQKDDGKNSKEKETEHGEDKETDEDGTGEIPEPKNLEPKDEVCSILLSYVHACSTTRIWHHVTFDLDLRAKYVNIL